MIEFVDYRGQAALETDPGLDLPPQPEIAVSDISKKPADDTGQHNTDRGHDQRHLLRTFHRVDVGVVTQRPVVATESHGSNHRWHRTALARDSGYDPPPIVGNQFAVRL